MMNRKEVASRIEENKRQRDAMWGRIKSQSEILENDSKHISRLSKEVESLTKRYVELNLKTASQGKMMAEQEERTHNILRILKKSGVIEVLLEDNQLLQLQNTTDLLHRNPLYKINKVCTRV